MNSKHRSCLQVNCEICGHQCRSELKSQNICRSCYRQQLSHKCKHCGLMKHKISETTGLCPRCIELVNRPTAMCSSCSEIKIIHDQQRWLCQKCCKNTNRRDSRDLNPTKKVECSVCNKVRVSALAGQAICYSCFVKKQNGIDFCKKCNRQKVIYNKSQYLCKQCAAQESASALLQDYVKKFTTPYPYNKYLFEVLTSIIRWEFVTELLKQSFRDFGSFLQTHPLQQPLTWEAIKSASSTLLESTNPTKAKRIRNRLFDLGHLLAAKGQMESLETYRARNRALNSLARVPENIQLILGKFAASLWERDMQPMSVRHYMEDLVKFWRWCIQRGIQSPEQVASFLVNDYLYALFWQWRCSKCKEVFEFDPCDDEEPRVCTQCGAVHSLSKVKRYSQDYVRHHGTHLRVFFNWAKTNKLVLFNPVMRRVKAPLPKIIHYPFEVIEQLSQYIVSPEADPTEALTLYLIIFHSFTSWELRHTKISNLLGFQDYVSLPTLAEAYYLIVPKLPISRGRRSPRRYSTQLDFSPIATFWLKSLLERFEHQRQQRLRNPKNQYLLTAPGQTRHDKPVCSDFVKRIVLRASQRAIKAICSPKILRITSAVMYADRAGGGVLEGMGWGDQQAFFYSWGPREVIYPEQIDTCLDEHLNDDIEFIHFPSKRAKSLADDFCSDSF